MQEAIPKEAETGDGVAAEDFVKHEAEDKEESRSLLQRLKRQLCVWLVAGPRRQVIAHHAISAFMSLSLCPCCSAMVAEPPQRIKQGRSLPETKAQYMPLQWLACAGQ